MLGTSTINACDITPGQLGLLDAFDPFVLLAGGFGSAKSTALQLKAMQLKCENGRAPGLMMAETYSELYANLVDPFLERLEANWPARAIPRKVADTAGRRSLVFPDGSLIHLRSADNERGYAGLNVGWLVGDELRLWRKSAYTLAIARVRVPCPRSQRAFASTPEMGWMADEFNTGKPMHRLIRAPTSENARHLDPTYIESLMSSYSPRLRRAYLEGEFTVLEGAVFDQFDPESKASPWFVDFDAKAQAQKHKVILAVDPGFRRSAWLWICEVGQLEWVVFDEMVPDGISDMACVEAVNNRGWPIDEIWVDPAGDNTQSVSGLDTFAALKNIKPRVNGTRLVRTIDTFRSITFGVDKLRVLLGGYEGMPRRLLFARRLVEIEAGKPRGIVRDLAALRYPADKDGRAVHDAPLKDGLTDHTTDALRYFAVGRWMAVPELRRRDPSLAKLATPGFRVAA